MADDATSRSVPDRRYGASEYVLAMARKYGLTTAQVEDLLRQYGRARLDAAARRLPD